ncbi:hypothetical protein KAS14_04845 [Candidatus Bathyarchaeota archaeon]|nr:hypothetical protein [Candidatus Bathyarchaeota archaeon]
MAKASVSAAYKLEWILGVKIAQPIQLFQTITQNKDFFATAKRKIVRKRLPMILKKFAHFNFKVTTTKMAPFDFIAQLPDEQLTIIGGVTGKNESNITQRIEEITSISKVINAQPVFITDGNKPLHNIPTICWKELEGIKFSEDLTTLLS